MNFQTGEGADSVLEGFTITNGFSGINCQDYSSPTIRGNLITGNHTYDGGGIRCYYSDPIIIGNTITVNSASYNGGGVYCKESAATIMNNTISGNSAVDDGGGIYCWYSSQATIVNNLITDTTLSGGGYNGSNGGGIYCRQSFPLTITNNAITDNSASDYGGGIYCDYAILAITNTILWDNSAPTGPEIEIRSSGGSVTVTYCDVKGGWTGTGNIDADPLFVTGPLGDYYLSQIAAGQALDSPCVDAGDPTSTIIGTTRTDEVQDSGVVDMGYHYPLP